MKRKFSIMILILLVLQYSCSKSDTKPTGKIAFWVSYDNGCGPITVTIDGSNVGQIQGWQAFPPSGCSSSNLLLVASTTQGSKSVTFKNNCKTWSTTINLNSDCYVYNVY